MNRNRKKAVAASVAVGMTMVMGFSPVLAANTDISKELGTRHRAAVGISKEYDAIAIVVSEESGKISIAKDGTLIVDVKEDALKKILIKNIITNRLDEKEKNKLARLKNIQELKKKDKEESKENKEADK